MTNYTGCRVNGFSLLFQEGAIQTMSGAATPMFFSGTRASSESGEVGMYMQGGDFGSQGSFAQDNGYGNQLGQMQGIQEQTAYPGYGQGDFQGHLNQGQGQYQQEAVADQSQYQNQYQAVTDEGQGQQADGNQWQQYGAGENQGGSEVQNNWQQGTAYRSHFYGQSVGLDNLATIAWFNP